jgi:hypothetical protein
MRRLRFNPARPLVAVVSAAAVVGGLMAGTALAAQRAPAGRHAAATAVTAVTWHRLALRDGWRSSRSLTYNVANPAYAINAGIVYLDGALHQVTGSKTEFAVLPPAARPARTVFLTVWSGSGTGTPGTVQISPNGVMTASAPTGSTRVLTSLAAVDFPAAGGPWTTMALRAGWRSGAAKFHTGGPAYTVRAGIVYLSGSLFSNGTGAFVTRLGKNARPRSVLYISVYNHGGLAGEVVIFPGGAVYTYGASGHVQTALDGVSYPAAGARLAWHKFALSAGWSSSQSTYQTGDPEYAVRGPLVYLAGSMNYTSGGAALFAGFPKVARAVHEVVRQVYTYGGSTGTLALGTSGIASSTPSSDAQRYTSLAGVAYPRNS